MANNKLESNNLLDDEDVSSKFVEVFIHFFGYLYIYLISMVNMGVSKYVIDLLNIHIVNILFFSLLVLYIFYFLYIYDICAGTVSRTYHIPKRVK